MNDRYRPLSRRRRVLLLLLAVATAVAVLLMLLHPPGAAPRIRQPPAPCAPGSTAHCVGGKVDVIVPSRAASVAPAAGDAHSGANERAR